MMLARLIAAIFVASLPPNLATGEDMPPPVEYVLNVGHSDTINTLAFSADGAMAASAGYDRSVKLWHVASGKLMRTLTGHRNAVYSLAFSPDGARVVAGGEDSPVELWDTATGTVVRTFEPHGRVFAVAFSPDSAQVAIGGEDKRVRLWDAAAGTLISVLDHGELVSAIAFSPNGERIASSSSEKLRIFDAKTGKLVSDAKTAAGHTSTAFSPDGTRIVTQSLRFSYTSLYPSYHYDPVVQVWDAETGKELRKFTFRRFDVARLMWGSNAVFSPDGKHILMGGAWALMLDADSGETVRNFTGWGNPYNSDQVGAVAFSPDGKRVLASVFSDLKFYDATDGSLLQTVASTDTNGLAISARGDRLASIGEYAVGALWDIANGRYVSSLGDKKYPCRNCSLLFSADGLAVIATPASDGASVWNAGDGKELFKGGMWGSPDATALTRDASRLFTGVEKNIEATEVRGTRKPQLIPAHNTVRCLALSTDEKRLLSGGEDKTVKLWDIASWNVLRTFAIDFFDDKLDQCTLAFSKDGTRVLLKGQRSSGGTWDAATGEYLNPARAELRNAVTGATLLKLDKTGQHDLTQLSPGGASLATNSADHTIQLWNTADGKLLRTLAGPSAKANALAFSPDGNRVAAGGDDAAVRIWDIGTGRLLLTYSGHTSAIRTLIFSPDGKFILSRSKNAPAQVWDTADGALALSFPDARAVFSQDSRRLAYADGGAIVLTSLETRARLLSLLATKAGDWIAATPEGFFTASANGAARLLSAVRGRDLIDIRRAEKSLDRPDLVGQKLAGDPAGLVKAAAAQVDLK
jgi:WD40 repeat protein